MLKALVSAVLSALFALTVTPALAGNAVLKDCGRFAPGDGTIVKFLAVAPGGDCDASSAYEWQDVWLGFSVRSWGNQPVGDPQVIKPIDERMPAEVCRYFTPDGLTVQERSTRFSCADHLRSLPYRIYDFKAQTVTLMPIAVRIGFDKLTDLGRRRVEEARGLAQVATAK